MRLSPGALAAALLLPWLSGCAPEAKVVDETRAVEQAWVSLRESVLQSDDEAFFLMHSRRAREEAVEVFPAIRARYLGSPRDEKVAFRTLFRVSEDEFLHGDPRDLVVKMMPWKSGFRARREMFRLSKVKDVRINAVQAPDGTESHEGVVILDISASLDPEEAKRLPERYLPRVVFVKDEDGWRRKAFLSETAATKGAEKSQEDG
ncbi:MAG: hypothetical protein ACYTG4_02610 [Planctomycetota bacterium]